MSDQLPALAGDNKDAIDRERDYAPRLAAALEAVIELHEPEETGVEVGGAKEPDYCLECKVYQPCPTVQTIHNALEGDE